MTTKVFQFRLAKFSILNTACRILIDNQHLDFIYHVFGVTNQKLSVDSYVPFPEATPDSLYNHVFEFLYFDKFTRHDFLLQFKYFKTFCRSISENQMFVLKNSHKVDSLLHLLLDDDYTESCSLVVPIPCDDSDNLPF